MRLWQRESPFTSTEAAGLLGVSRTHLVRLCDEGRIESYKVGNALRISSDEVMRILTARGQAKTEAREAAATADQRRPDSLPADERPFLERVAIGLPEAHSNLAVSSDRQGHPAGYGGAPLSTFDGLAGDSLGDAIRVVFGLAL